MMWLCRALLAVCAELVLVNFGILFSLYVSVRCPGLNNSVKLDSFQNNGKRINRILSLMPFFFTCFHMENVSGISVSNFNKTVYFSAVTVLVTRLLGTKVMNQLLVSKFWFTSFFNFREPNGVGEQKKANKVNFHVKQELLILTQKILS